MRVKRVLGGLFLIGAILVGCSGDLEFAVQFKAINGLRAGDRLLAEELAIGSVPAVDYTDQGDYRVAVTVARAHAAKLDRNSIFYIDADPQRPERKALMAIAASSRGGPIADDQTLEGTTKWAALIQRMTRRMENTLAGLAVELDQFWQDLQNLSTSEQAQRLEQELDRILAELKRLSASAQHQLKTEILPRLREKLEDLRRQLAMPEHENQLDRLENKMDRIERELQV
jgi:ABC-type transporter Mla subunit MlaD